MATALSLSRTALAFLTAIVLVCLGVDSVPPDAGAGPEETGLEIARDARALEEGFENFTARQTMLLRNKHGQESRRQLQVKVLEVSGDGDKSLFVFDEPRDGHQRARSRASRKRRRPVALSSSSEAGEAHQLGEPLRLLHGKRVRL